MSKMIPYTYIYNILKFKHPNFKFRTKIGILHSTKWHKSFRRFVKSNIIFAIDSKMRSAHDNSEVTLLSITSGRIYNGVMYCITWIIWYGREIPIPIDELYDDNKKLKVTYYNELDYINNVLDLQKYLMINNYNIYRKHYKERSGELLSLGDAITYLTPYLNMVSKVTKRIKIGENIIIDDIVHPHIWLPDDNFTPKQEAIVVSPSVFTFLVYKYNL